MRPLPTVDEVLARLGTTSALLSHVAGMVEECLRGVRAYTRGSGFDSGGQGLADDLARLVVDSVVRALSNPELPLASSQPAFHATPGAFGEWTHDELRTLERYRTAQSTD